MPKASKEHTKSKYVTDTIPRYHVDAAIRHYRKFAKRFSKSMLVPKSNVRDLFQAIMIISRCWDNIQLCTECKCFHRVV